MGFFGVIPDQIIHKETIKIIWFIDVIGMVISKLFLNSTIESFQMSIRLGMMRIVKIMYQFLLLAFFREKLEKLMPVICLNP